MDTQNNRLKSQRPATARADAMGGCGLLQSHASAPSSLIERRAGGPMQTRRSGQTHRISKKAPKPMKPGGCKYLVLCDDGTGKNAGHLYGTYRSLRTAQQKAQEAESIFPWCVGAWVKRVPKDHIHDPSKPWPPAWARLPDSSDAERLVGTAARIRGRRL